MANWPWPHGDRRRPGERQGRRRGPLGQGLEHKLANLRGSHDGEGAILRGAVVNGPNAASKQEELNSLPTTKKCTAAPPPGAWTDFDGKGARYVVDVGAWQTVEPALDFTTTALLAFALTAQSGSEQPSL